MSRLFRSGLAKLFIPIAKEENGMTSSTVDEVKDTAPKSKTKKDLRKLDDPTLEGKDETKIGRVQRKTDQAEEVLEK